MHLRSKKQELKVCEQPAPRSPLTALQMLSNSCQHCCDQSRRLQERQQQRQSPLNTSHTVDDTKVEFSKDAFSLEAEKPEWRFQAWRRRTQRAVFVSSQDRRSREKHCVFIRQDRAAKGVFAPFHSRGQQLLHHPSGSILPATSTKGAKSSWVDTEWPQHCIWKGTHTWTRTDRLLITAQSGRRVKLLSFFPGFLYI